jgi:hypothetical protein
MPDGGFWEVGRENADGAITGTVWKPWSHDPSRVVKKGGFRIEPDGTVTRFPGLSVEERREAAAWAKKRYREVFESCPFSVAVG